MTHYDEGRSVSRPSSSLSIVSNYEAQLWLMSDIGSFLLPMQFVSHGVWPLD